MDIFYLLLGLLLIVYEAVENVWKSAAASVGGEGVLLALIVGCVALTMALNVREKVAELLKQVKALEDKVERSEDKFAEKEMEDEELAQKVEGLEEEELVQKVEGLEDKFAEKETVEELAQKLKELTEKLAEKETVEELAQKVEGLEEKFAEKEQEAAWQRIREEYGGELDDEAVTMIHDIERDPYISQDNKRLAIGLEIVENHRRQKAKQEERHD